MAEPTPQSILYGLPLLEFRGLTHEVYDVAPVSVTHSQAERRYPYVDGAGHDHTGRDPLRMNSRLYFINTLREGAFPDQWEQWRAALLDGSSGDFRHPVMGPMSARVMAFDVDVDASKTLAGVIVNVTWSDTVDNPAQASDFQTLTINPTALARATDEALSRAGIDFPEGGPANLADVFSQVDGFIFSASAQVGGLINQAKDLIGTMIDLVDASQDHTKYPAYDLLNQLYSSAIDLGDRLGGAISRTTSEINFSHPTTFNRVSSVTGNTVEELMSLNLALLRSPQIPANRRISYYTS